MRTSGLDGEVLPTPLSFSFLFSFFLLRYVNDVTEVLRDTELHNIPLDTVFDRYVRFSKRAFEETIYPTKPLADIILPRGPEAAAIDLIAMGVWDDIREKREGGSGRGDK